MGFGVAGATAASSAAAPALAAGDAPWRPARHAQDDWLDKIPGEHRFVFDTTTAEGMAWAFRFATNYFAASKEAYGLKENDLAVVIVARHKSTPFGFTDAIWAKYGKQLAEHAEITDPKTKEPPTANLYTAAGDGSTEAGPMDRLIKRGVHFAVCEVSMRGIAGMVASDTGAKSEDIVTEMSANLVGNARLVPAGIVAVNRAQERGYSFVYAI